MKRMRAWQERENEVSHPLRRIILLEYEASLAAGLAASIPAGTWTPSSSYVVLVAKRSGTYRELAFPCLMDTIVGRTIIDALEPHVTADDVEGVFLGRSKANADRERGDYENWFQVWLDFSASIGTALECAGYTYVFDTDVTQFFPSIDRNRAKHALAQRTRAHQTLLEMLFFCVDSWCPRVRYCPVPGLPIEPNDISRIIAHNYIKGVDEHFIGDPTVKYMRWVDDTVVFVAGEKEAHDVKRKHHLALREMGLSPNASKTSIITAKEYSERRHPEFNRRIDAVKESRSADEVISLVTEWYGKDPKTTPSWDKVATRLYSAASLVRSEVLRAHAVQDIEHFPRLQRSAFRYLNLFEVGESDLEELMKVAGSVTASIETRIEIARFLCDARLSCPVGPLVNFAMGQIMAADVRLGAGYAQALLLLCVNKHGNRDHRNKLRKHLTLERLQDDQLRLHYLYVYYCRNELDDKLARAARHSDTPDIALLMRVCRDAKKGALQQFKRALDLCFAKHGEYRTIWARYLPFVGAILRSEAEGRRDECVAWLNRAVSEKVLREVGDAAIRRFLSEEYNVLTR